MTEESTRIRHGLYRERIYNQYNSARVGGIVPGDLTDFAPRAPYLRKLVADHFPGDSEARILEVGCGYGALIHFARQAGYHNLRGVDGSPEQVEAARRLGIEGVEERDLRTVLAGEPDGSLDMVVAFDVLEHFTRDELVPFVDEIHRVLAPGGRWLIHVPNGGPLLVLPYDTAI